MKVKEIPIAEITPYANNPRNNAAAVEPVAASIRDFGFRVPIVLDRNGVIVAGHTRLEAAKRLGLSKVPCVVADDLTAEQARAFRIADNKTGELATWDMAKLDEELADISDFDMAEFGFAETPAPDSFGDSFSLPDGEKPEAEYLSVVLSRKQKEIVLHAFETVEGDVSETFGNTNKMGNCLYEVVRQWAELKRLS